MPQLAENPPAAAPEITPHQVLEQFANRHAEWLAQNNGGRGAVAENPAPRARPAAPMPNERIRRNNRLPIITEASRVEVPVNQNPREYQVWCAIINTPKNREFIKLADNHYSWVNNILEATTLPSQDRMLQFMEAYANHAEFDPIAEILCINVTEHHPRRR